VKRPEQQGWYWARWGGGPWSACHTAESDLHDEEDPNFEWGARILEPGEGPDVARALELLRELQWPARMYEYERGVQEAIAALKGAASAPDRHMNSNAGGGEQTNTRPSELGTPEVGDSKVTSDSATGSTAAAPAAEAPDLPDGWDHHHPLEGHEYADAEGFVRVWVSNDGTRVRVTNGRPPTVADVHAVLAYHRALLGGTCAR
jgi:hypothetical protein